MAAPGVDRASQRLMLGGSMRAPHGACALDEQSDQHFSIRMQPVRSAAANMVGVSQRQERSEQHRRQSS